MKYKWLFLIVVVLVSCREPVARKPVNKKLESRKDYTVAYHKTLNKFQEDKIQAYVQRDSLVSYQNSSYGFVYAFLKASDKSSKKVANGDEVTYLKTVYSLEDQLIYEEQKVTTIVGKSNEVTGIDEGLKLMEEDEEIKFIFTSFVAHGFYGDRNKIGRNMPIIVKIKLLKINN
ncbi:FKBP-type peptidyl-prolyl cis-trans isomerase [Wenyingzhuangia sp. IMCC45533]